MSASIGKEVCMATQVVAGMPMRGVPSEGLHQVISARHPRRPHLVESVGE